MNVYDIAEKAGVSIATVSRVLNHPESVSAATFEKVSRAIKESNYTPSSLARGLGSGRTKTVGVVCTDISDMYYASAVCYLEKELRQSGYDVLLSCADSKDKAVQMLISKGVEGVFLIGSVFNEKEDNGYIAAAAEKMPVFIINGEIDMENVYCFLSNEENAVAQAVTALSRRGRKHILYLYDAMTPSGIKKLDGYRKGLANAGLTANIIKVEKSAASVAAALSELIVLGVPFDAVVASEDIIAAAAVNTLLRHRISVPGEVAVIGINNLALTEYCYPSITSIDIQLEPLCHLAVNALLDVNGQKAVKSKTILTSEIVYRESFKFDKTDKSEQLFPSLK